MQPATDAWNDRDLAGNWLSWSPESLTPSRWNRHIPLLAWIFDRLAPQLCVQLGVHNGESFRPLCQLVDRFSDGGTFIGIDSWVVDPSGSWAGESQYQGLTDYLATHHPDSASLLRLDLAEAVREFEDESIDFLHVAAMARWGFSTAFDPSIWTPKLRPGGVIVVTCTDELRADDDTEKAWQQISECYPSAPIRLPGFVGVAQRPRNDQTPLTRSLGADPRVASALFRLLGERIEFRHALSSEPLSATGIQKYIAELVNDHAGDIHRRDAQHETARRSLNEQLASTYDRLRATSEELGRFQNEANYLMAKLADQSAQNERLIAGMEATHAAEIAGMEAAQAAEVQRLNADLATLSHRCGTLEARVAEQAAHIDAIQRTVSWRLTRPLRVMQALQMKIRRHAG